MAKLLKFYAGYERQNLVAPTSTRQIGAELNLSHMQVARLRRRAIEDKLIVFDDDGYVTVRKIADATNGFWCYSVPFLRRNSDGTMEQADEERRVVLDRHLLPAGRPVDLLAIAGPNFRQTDTRLRVTAASTLIVREVKNFKALTPQRWHLFETKWGPKIVQVRYDNGVITEGASLSGATPLRLEPTEVIRAFEIRYVINDPHAKWNGRET